MHALDHFWIGYLVAVGTYLTIGLFIGVHNIVSYLSHFHGGGFQWRRMARQIVMIALVWPIVFVR